MGRRLVAALRADLTGQGLCSLLRHGDRNSMRWTIESRVPFLTIEMAEFLLSLPESYLLGPDGETKRIFRAAMRGIVPDKILDRRDKIGFQTPEKNWLRSQNAKIEQWLSTAETLSFINLKQGREEINGMLDGSKTFGWHAWVLINFCRWVQVQGQ
jgi:asparagine synthase (glutamine-hydrolysing)